MTIPQLKDRITTHIGSSLTRLIADNWDVAEKALCEISNNGFRETPVEQYPLQMLCLAINNKDGFHEHNSAKKEQLVEKMKTVLNPIKAMLDSQTELELPIYSLAVALIPQDGEQNFFINQLQEDFKLLNQQASDALALTMYAVVYAYYGDFEDGVVEQFLRFYVDNPYEVGNFSRMTDDEQIGMLDEATKKMYGTPRTKASAAASNSQHGVKKISGKWLPLKIYLIATTLFVALVFGLAFWSISSDVGSSSMSIMDRSGQMVSIEPGMEPVTLFLFGTVDYDGVIAGIKTAVIIFLIWRVVLTIAIYVFNARRRRRYHP